MKSLFLTRKQYDALVSNLPNWMSLRWAEYSKMWSIGGVNVTGTQCQIENLQVQIKSCK